MKYDEFAVTQASLWETKASAISMGMNCSQVNAMKYTIVPSSNSEIAHKILAVLSDKDGCVFNHEDVLQATPGQENVMVAVWDQLKGNNKGSAASCPEFRQFAYAGQVPVDVLKRSSSSALNSTSFGGIACDPSFMNYEGLPVLSYRRQRVPEPLMIAEHKAAGVNDVDIFDLSPYKAKVPIPGLSQVFGSSLSSTIFLANLTKDLVDPILGKTFWGESGKIAYRSGFDLADSNANWSCSAVGDFADLDWISEEWTDEQACKLYGGVKGIYVSVASLTAGSVAQFIAKDAKLTGKLGFERSVWVLEQNIVFVSVGLHLIALIFLGLIYFPMKTLVTGLYGNPSSIAAKMFYFRHKHMRELFQGLDAYAAKEPIAFLGKRMDASTFKWQIKKEPGAQKRSGKCLPRF